MNVIDKWKSRGASMRAMGLSKYSLTPLNLSGLSVVRTGWTEHIGRGERQLSQPEIDRGERNSRQSNRRFADMVNKHRLEGNVLGKRNVWKAEMDKVKGRQK